MNNLYFLFPYHQLILCTEYNIYTTVCDPEFFLV